MAICWPAKVTGLVVISSCNFMKVMIEPEKDTLPTNTVNATATRKPSVSAWESSRRATTAAAPPPTPLNRATNCGIWVIWTAFDASTAMMEPATTTPKIHAMLSISFERKTVTTPITAPRAPRRFPRRAVFGELSPFRARMKRTAATR